MGPPTLARLCEGFHRRTSLMSSSLLFQQFSGMSCQSYLDGFKDEKLVAVQLLFCRILLTGFVKYSSKHSCVISV